MRGGASPVFATGTVTTTNQITGCGYIILHITGIFSDVTSCLNQVVDQIYGPGRFSVCNVVPSSPTAGSVGLFNGTCGGPNFYNNSLGPISCPANSTGTTTCTCNTGYQPDSTGTSCVPVSTCTVTTPLTPLDPAVQPYEDGLIDMVNVTQGTRDGAACIARVARAYRPRIIAGLVSGYRPPAYQTHIREVYDKWQLLKNN